MDHTIFALSKWSRWWILGWFILIASAVAIDHMVHIGESETTEAIK